MAQNLIVSLSLIKSNLFRCTRFTPNVKSFQTLGSTVHHLRCNNNSASLSISSIFKFRPTSITPHLRRTYSQTYQEVDTNIVNNIVLWKFENSKYFRNLRIFIIVQFVVFIASSYVMYGYLPSLDKYGTYKEYIKENALFLIATLMPIIIVFSTTLLVWFFETRSLRSIILHKGGKNASLVSYHPIKGSKQVVVPVHDIIVPKGRQDTGHYLSVKVKNTKFFYLMDKEGIFVNPQFFDATVGILKTAPTPLKK